MKILFKFCFLLLSLLINFQPLYATDFYWVGGTGNWSDYGNHWATSSGGVIYHTTIPGPLDNIYFDSNSFLIANDTLKLDVSLLYGKDMDWNSVTNIPKIKDVIGNSVFSLFGSLILKPGMNNFPVIDFCSANTGNVITTAGAYILGTQFSGAGGWLLMDSLKAGVIILLNGSLNTNNQVIDCYRLDCGWQNSITLILGTSIVTIDHDCSLKPPLLSLYAASSTIICHIFESGENQVYKNLIIGNLQADSIQVENLIVEGGSISNSTVQYAEINGGLSINNSIMYNVVINGSVQVNNSTMYQVVINSASGINGFNNTMQKVICSGSVRILGINTMDTLIFNNPGSTVWLDSILYINNEIWANTLPGFPIIIKNYTPQKFPTISSQSGNTICFDYVYLNHISATGGALFYAGDHSLDLGGNTGWLWSSCTPDTSNVWPGDANYDLTADNIDILYIGLAYGYTGPVRVGASTNWVAQPGIDWLQQFATGYNIKHADCDGNGTVNAVDTNAVSLNYGLVHPFKNPSPPLVNNFGTDLYFDIPPTSLTPGADVDIPIMFGTNTNAAQNVYGIAFTVNYNPAFIQANTAEITFNNCWFGNAGNTIHLSKDFYNSGFVDMAVVKTDHQNETGNGQLATLHFKVANNASGYLNLSFSKVLVLDKSEIQQQVNVINGLVYTGIENSNLPPDITVYPNPSNDKLFIKDPQQLIKQVKLIDPSGRSHQMSSANTIEVSQLTSGFYQLEILTRDGLYRKKMTVIH